MVGKRIFVLSLMCSRNNKHPATSDGVLLFGRSLGYSANNTVVLDRALLRDFPERLEDRLCRAVTAALLFWAK